MSDQNPFHLLGLPVSASTETIVERAEELCTIAQSDAERAAFNDARLELIREPLSRARHALLEMPGTDYRDEQWSDFERRYRRPPVNARELRARGRPLTADDFDLGAILDLLLDGLLTLEPLDVTPGLQDPPVRPGPGPVPLEVRDVLFG
jgi:hypothetical protein